MLTTIKNNSNTSFSGKNLASSMIKTVDVPKYGIHFHNGDIGFVVRKQTRTIVDFGIAYATRWQNKSGINVAHTFIVEDGLQCIEAKSPGGVVETKLRHYFNNKDFDVFLRTPKGMTKEIADEIVKNAKKEKGEWKYDNLLILNGFGRGTLLGHLIDRATKHKAFDRQAVLLKSLKRLKLVTGEKGLKELKWVDGKNHFICSELAVHCLQKIKQWPYYNKGILNRPAAGINPQELFEDEKIFEPTIVKVHKI